MRLITLRPAVIALTLTLLAATAITGRAQTPSAAPDQSASPDIPLWAYPVVSTRPKLASATPAPKSAEEAIDRHVPGSTQTYKLSPIRDLFVIPDWFPNDHPKMPPSVGVGRKPDAVPCGYCHLPNGLGRPENQSIAGLPKDYIIQQVKDFASDARHSSESRMGSVNYMIRVSKAVTPEELAEAADYFSKLKLTKWIRVVETDTVPKTRIDNGMLVAEKEGKEAIGSRIIEVSEDYEQTELRNQKSGFIAYVPTGSLKAGESIVKTGANGKTMACGMCHGADLKGMANVPGIAGRSPSQMTRQLIDFRGGARSGQNAAMMKMPVAKLTDEDILAITAYLASLEP